jgi:hypothetical protein
VKALKGYLQFARDGMSAIPGKLALLTAAGYKVLDSVWSPSRRLAILPLKSSAERRMLL